MERKKLLPDQRVFIYVGTEEADDTDKTLMAGNIKQAYIDSSLRYYHGLIAGGVLLENLSLKVQLEPFTMKYLGQKSTQLAYAFLQKIGN